MYAFWRIVEFFALRLWTGEKYEFFVIVRLLQMVVCNRRSNCQTSTIRQKMGIFCIILRVGAKKCVHGGRALVAMCCLSLSFVSYFSFLVRVFLDLCPRNGFYLAPPWPVKVLSLSTSTHALLCWYKLCRKRNWSNRSVSILCCRSCFAAGDNPVVVMYCAFLLRLIRVSHLSCFPV